MSVADFGNFLLFFICIWENRNVKKHLSILANNLRRRPEKRRQCQLLYCLKLDALRDAICSPAVTGG